MVDQTRYISCSLGYGFVRTCAPGTIWSQEILTCLMPEEPKMIEQVLPKLVEPVPSVQSYGQQKPTMPTMPKPVQQKPMMPTMPMMPKPVQSFGQQKPMSQSPLKPSYGEKMLSFFRY